MATVFCGREFGTFRLLEHITFYSCSNANSRSTLAIVWRLHFTFHSAHQVTTVLCRSWRAFSSPWYLANIFGRPFFHPPGLLEILRQRHQPLQSSRTQPHSRQLFSPRNGVVRPKRVLRQVLVRVFSETPR